MTILQSRLSGMYFKGFGLWVAQVTEALRFDTSENARKFIEAERITDVLLRDAQDFGAGDMLSGREG